MPIFAEVKTGTDLKLEEVIALAKGQIDQYGKPFDTITVSCKSGKNSFYGKAPHRTSGFEDAFIKVNEDGSININYRGTGETNPGTIDFVRNKLGMLEAIIPKTEHNIKMLAVHEKQGWWTYKDADVRTMIMKKYQEILDNRTIEQIEMDEQMYAPKKVELEKEAAGFNDTEYTAKLKAIEDKHREEMAFMQKQLAEAKVKAIASVPKPAVEAKSSPAAEYNELKKRAALLGVQVDKTMKLGVLKEKIKEAEETLKTAETNNDNQPVSNVSQE